MGHPEPTDLADRPEAGRSQGGPSRRALIGWTILLALPAGIPCLVHYFPRGDGLIATGYVHYDYPIYFGKGREHFDPGSFRWTYSQPCSDRYDESRIYAQPWTLALGLAHRWLGLRPGVIYNGFWAAACLFCVGSAVLLYREVVGLDTRSRRVGLALFVWGGGLLAAGGVALSWLRGEPVRQVEAVFRLDPSDGWWFLNLGRNLIFPTEALYHGLTFCTILAVIRRRFVAAGLWATLTAADSPFAGAGLLATLWAWGAVEVAFLRNRERVAGFFAFVNGLIAGFVGYYVAFLGRFEEHRQVARQMEFLIEYNARSFVPALILVGPLAAWTLRDSGRAARELGSIRGRLLLAWAAVSFALSQHEFAVEPRQPIHFDRGYPWVALFLLGAPTLVALLDGLGRLPRLVGGPLVAALVLGFVSDNLAWFAQFPVAAALRSRSEYHLGFLLKPDQLDVLRALDDRRFYGDLVLIDDPELSYLVIAETPLRSWYSHLIETRDALKRRQEVTDLMKSGTFLDAWEGRPLLIVAPGTGPMPDWVAGRSGVAVHRNGSYIVYRIPASTRPTAGG